MLPTSANTAAEVFLLTPLREGRRNRRTQPAARQPISTHAPAGGATFAIAVTTCARMLFLLTPLREGRQLPVPLLRGAFDFYSRPCGRGDIEWLSERTLSIFISTHAPAGGATK